MKKTFLFLIMAAGLLSCTKEPVQQEVSAGVPMNFEINVTETKAAKTSWEDGDEIVLFFKGIEDNFILFSYNEETQKWDERISYDTFTSSDFENLEENILSAVHLPGISSIILEDGYFSFFGKDEKPIFNYYLAQTGVPYTVDGTTVSASFTMEKPEGFVQFHVAGIEKTVNNYTFASPQVRPVALSGINFDGTLREEVLQAGARLSGFADADGAVFAGRLAKAGTRAVATPSYTFTLASTEKIYTYDLYDKTLEAGKRYNFPALTGSGWSVVLASELYVDLGLPSGLKWAKFNLGASTETDYGDYFAWGEIAPKTDYSWATYKWMQEGQSDWKYITKYTFADGQKNGIWYSGDTFIGDGKKSLQDYDNADDAAYAALGGKFRMPTEADWQELYNNCTWTWKTTADGYASNGRLVTASNGNTIFLPAAGYRNGTELDNAGAPGRYWSSSLFKTFSDGVKSMNFNSGGADMSSSLRYYGIPVRPVSD